VLPGLYLRGLSAGDFEEGLKALLGKEASAELLLAASHFHIRLEDKRIGCARSCGSVFARARAKSSQR